MLALDNLVKVSSFNLILLTVGALVAFLAARVTNDLLLVLGCHRCKLGPTFGRIGHLVTKSVLRREG